LTALFPKSPYGYQRGDVVYVPFTYSDFTGGKARPALIISTDDYHGDYLNILLAAITGEVAKHTGKTTAYEIQDWRTAGLKIPSVVYPHILTLAVDYVGRKIGRLTDADMQDAEACLRKALGF
jgi:mRNA interferase MazF